MTTFQEKGATSMWTTLVATASTTTTQTKTPCMPWSYPMCDPYIIATYYFTVYGTTMTYVVGIPGNFLTTVILARMRPFNSSTIWLLALTCTDLYSLTLRLVCSLIDINNPQILTEWFCKFFYIMCDFCEQSSYLYLVGLTLERFIAVWFPLKMAIWCTKRRAVIWTFVIQVLCVCTNIHYVETMRLRDGYCIIKAKYLQFFQYIFQSYIQNTINWFLPAVALITLNILILIRLNAARTFQKQMTDQQSKIKEKQQKQINRMLMASSVWFTLCISLEVVYRYTNTFWGPRLPREPISDRARIIVMNVSAGLRMYNAAVNFILYVIAARKFRSEVIRLITCNMFVGIGKRSTNISKSYMSDTKVTSDGSSHSD